jgi:hypothetical protein
MGLVQKVFWKNIHLFFISRIENINPKKNEIKGNKKSLLGLTNSVEFNW